MITIDYYNILSVVDNCSTNLSMIRSVYIDLLTSSAII